MGAADIEAFYAKYDGKSMLNYGLGVGHELGRIVVLDNMSIENASDPTYAAKSRGLAEKADGHASWAVDIPDEAATTDMFRLYEQGLEDGAVGVASTLGYMGYGVSTQEVFELQKLAKKYDRIFAAHTRFGPTERLPTDFTLGTREVIANAVALDGALILSHIQNHYADGWEEAYNLARLLQQRGMVIFAEYYPSGIGNPNIATPQLKKDTIAKNSVDIETMPFDPTTGENFTEDEFWKQQEEDPSKVIFIEVSPPENLRGWVHMKHVAIANDILAFPLADGSDAPIGMPYEDYQGHPRNPGTYGTVFRVAREEGIPLMDIVHNASYTPAKYFSMVGLKAIQERGRMQEGMIADITIFDPETIRENATMKLGEQGLPTTGIPYVLVGGAVVVDNSVVDLNATPG